MTAMHFALFITLSGIALSGTAIISFNTLAELSIRLSMSDWFLSSSAAQLEPMNREQMPSTRRHLSHMGESVFIVSPSVLLVSTYFSTATLSYLLGIQASIQQKQ